MKLEDVMAKAILERDLKEIEQELYKAIIILEDIKKLVDFYKQTNDLEK